VGKTLEAAEDAAADDDEDEDEDEDEAAAGERASSLWSPPVGFGCCGVGGCSGAGALLGVGAMAMGRLRLRPPVVLPLPSRPRPSWLRPSPLRPVPLGERCRL